LVALVGFCGIDADVSPAQIAKPEGSGGVAVFSQLPFSGTELASQQNSTAFMNIEAELAALKQENTLLRQEMNELKQFIHYHPAHEDKDGLKYSAHITMQCAAFQLIHPTNPGWSQVNIMGGKTGAFVAVCGKDERTRVLMQVDNNVPELSLFGKDNQYKACLRMDKDEPSFELYGKEGKIGVQLKALGETGLGQVGVCSAGKPRAVMKATDQGAAISAVHDDGHARITMVSTESNGELLAVTPDMQVGVKIAANGLDGGLITVNRANGKAGVILSNTAVGGTVIVQDQHANITGHLPVVPEV
jgi:hypothetical protein